MARSPVWNRGSMLIPWVVTYVVPPPRVRGQNIHTAASTSAAAALMLAALGTAFMAKAPVQEGGVGGSGQDARRDLDGGGPHLERQGARLGGDRRGGGEHDVGQDAAVAGVPVVGDRGHRGTGHLDLAVTEDAVGRHGVAGGEGGGGDAGSGNRDTGEQNARLAHCRGPVLSVAQGRPDGVIRLRRRLRLFVDGPLFGRGPRSINSCPKRNWRLFSQGARARSPRAHSAAETDRGRRQLHLRPVDSAALHGRWTKGSECTGPAARSTRCRWPSWRSSRWSRSSTAAARWSSASSSSRRSSRPPR